MTDELLALFRVAMGDDRATLRVSRAPRGFVVNLSSKPAKVRLRVGGSTLDEALTEARELVRAW